MPSTRSRDVVARVLAISLLTSLAACGGGGSASSTSGGPSSNNPTGTPSEPAIPRALYSGTQAESKLDTSTALPIVQNAFPALAFLTDSAEQIRTPLYPYNYTTTLNGKDGGQDVITGTIAVDGSGWVEQQYQNYADGSGTVQNGVYTIYQQAPTDDVTSIGTLGFGSYQVTYQGQTFTYTGNIAYAFTASSYTFVGNLTVSAGAFQSYMSDLTISQGGDGKVTCSGRMYDSINGYVTVSTPTAVSLGATDIGFPQIYGPGATGDILLTGSHSALHVQALNIDFAFIGLDSKGTGSIDSGARLDYSTGELDATQPMGASVQALAEVPSAATAGAAVTVDGRYSFTPNGFVTYAWKLLSVPPGSALRTTGSSATQSFTPDLTGTYLWQLTATAGGNSTFDLVPVDVAVTSGSATLESNVTGYKAPSYIYAHAGDTVTLDGRASPILRSAQANSSLWTLSAPAGSSATLSGLGPVTSFVADKPGFYTAELDQSADVTYRFLTVIAVDEPYRFAPAVPLVGAIGVPGVNTIEELARVSLGGSSSAVIFNEAKNGSLGSYWANQQLTLSNDGYFKSPTALTPQMYLVPLLGTDLNGDGATDFVSDNSTSFVCSLEFSESSVSGGSVTTYNAQTVSLPSPPSCQGSFMGQYAGGSIGGKPAVVALYYVNTLADQGPAFEAFPSDGSGTMQQPVLTAIQDMNAASFEKVYDFKLQDVDGDGEPDLVATIGFGPGGNNVTSVYLQIYHGNGDGSFTYSASYPLTGTMNLSGNTAQMLIDDFNGDSKLDIAVAFNDTLDLFYGNGSGDFSNTDTRKIDANFTPNAASAEYLTEMDINGDHHPDLVITGALSDAPNGPPVIKLFLSGTGGSLGNELEYPISDMDYQGATGSAVGDFNNDGLQDLVLSNSDQTTNSAAVFFMPQVEALTSGITTAYQPQSVTAAGKEEQPTAWRAPAGVASHATAHHAWHPTTTPMRALRPQP